MENKTKYCTGCGKPIAVDAKFCPNCGTANTVNTVNNTVQSAAIDPDATTKVNYYDEAVVDMRNVAEQPAKKVKGKAHGSAVAAFILGLFSLIPGLNLLTLLPALILTIVALAKSKGRKKGLAITALIFDIISIAMVVLAVVVVIGAINGAIPYFEDSPIIDEIKMEQNELLEYSYLDAYTWADTADSFVSIDTNPDDIEDYIEYDAVEAIEELCDELDFADSVFVDMNNTTLYDGMQTAYSLDNRYYAMWWYSSSTGLSVTFYKN